MSINSVFKRSSGVAQEDLKIKPPLTGFFKSLVPPSGDESMLDVCAEIIAAARAGIIGIDADELITMCELCDEFGRDVKQFQEKKPGAVASRLSAALAAALALYTAELSVGESPYGVCNGALRLSDRTKCKPFVPFIWYLMHALAKCDRYDGSNVFRGVKADLSADYPKDREVTWFQFSSCTCDIQVEQSEQFCGSAGTRTLFSIELTTGRARVITKFSLVPSEAEVLLPPNSRFKVLGQLNAGNGLVIIQLKELPPKDPIIDFDSPPTGTASFIPPALAAISGTFPAGSVLPAETEDPDVVALSQSLKALGIGTSAACLNFAKSLADQGVLTMERLKKMPVHQAKKALEIVKMTEFQIDAIIEVISPPPFAGPTSPASPAPAPTSALAAPQSTSAPTFLQAEELFQEGQRFFGQQRFSDAAKSWGQAVALNHGASHAFLSTLVFEGRPDVPKDRQSAFELASAGAVLGCAHSKGALGRCLVHGAGVAKDVARGVAIARESAAAGSCFGQSVVGRCHQKGLCVAQDYEEAVRLYRLAAMQGHSSAQNNLGFMFKKGEGVGRDYDEAVRLYRLAVAQGHADAQNNLGVMFKNGLGVAQDRAEAVRLFRLAAAQGNTDAAASLKQLGC
jgi:TPR repeat protein